MGQPIIPASAIRGRNWATMGAEDIEKILGGNAVVNGKTCKARCHLPDGGDWRYAGMNGLEKKYALYLDECIKIGKVSDWKFEKITLHLGISLKYLPDFFIVTGDGYIEFHDTKGFWRDDARAKIKMAAEMFPCITFRAVKLIKDKGWEYETFGSSARKKNPDIEGGF